MLIVLRLSQQGQLPFMNDEESNESTLSKQSLLRSFIQQGYCRCASKSVFLLFLPLRVSQRAFVKQQNSAVGWCEHYQNADSRRFAVNCRRLYLWSWYMNDCYFRSVMKQQSVSLTVFGNVTFDPVLFVYFWRLNLVISDVKVWCKVKK